MQSWKIMGSAATLTALCLPAAVAPLTAQAPRVVPEQMAAVYETFHYAPAVRAGDFLYLSGVVGAPQSEGEAGLHEAARQAFTTAGLVLAEAGYTFDDVVEMTSYHTDLEAQQASFQTVRNEFLSEPWPAWTALDIDRLWMPTAAVEIRFVAWREGAGAESTDVEVEPGVHAGPFAAVERQLAEGPWGLPFRVTATGAVEVDVSGEVAVEAGGGVRLVVRGTFAGQPVDHALRSDGHEAVLTTPAGEERMPAPPQLADALAVGLVRMGVLHNVARLVSGQLPDHAEGGVRSWVRLNPGPDAVDGGTTAAIRVLNVPSGTVELHTDASGMPVARRQEVAFPGGVMRVEERYGAGAQG